jgi:hypothetical protein
MKFIMMTPVTVIRRICLVIPLIFVSVAFAQSPPVKILYVGAISINPCQDAKVLADWYSRFGIETKEYRGGYYGKLDTAAGLFAFGIHPKKANAPNKCAASVSVVYRVENSKRACWPRKIKDSCLIRPKKIRTKGSLRTFTIQTAMKLLSGERQYEPD